MGHLAVIITAGVCCVVFFIGGKMYVRNSYIHQKGSG